MVNLRYHPASLWRVLANYNLLHAAESEPANGLAHAARAANEAAHPFYFQRSRFFFLCGHDLGPFYFYWPAIKRRPALPRRSCRETRRLWPRLSNGEARQK